MIFPSHQFRAPIVSEVLREAPTPREEINAVCDYLCTATVDAHGRRIKEREARSALKLLERL